ncbi:CotH kinase family protein, partial [Bacteriovoracaceae bacterium]|nr:CotH kinase family protein [Bacteriovoracaceae bacterium]
FEISKASTITNKIKREKHNYPNVKNDHLPSYKHSIKVFDLYIDDNDLYHPDYGIKANPKGRGKSFEKRGYLRIYDQDKKVFESFLGLRLHGGAHRGRSKTSKKSYRLYMRKKYGAEKINLLSQSQEKRKKYVLRVTARKPFVNEISFDFINKIGGIAPHAEPVHFFLNGENRGFYHLTEFIEKELWLKKTDSKDLIFYKYKGSNSPSDTYLFNELNNFIANSPAPLKLKKIKSLIDMDNYMAHIFSIIYLGCSDWVQGALFKENLMDAKWKFISWDYDKALTVMDSHKRKRTEKAVNLNAFEFLISPYKPDLRSTLFNRLLKEDKNFAPYLKQSFNRLLNEIDQTFVNRIMQSYQLFVQKYANDLSSDVEEIRLFLINRKSVVENQLKQFK